MSNRTKLELGTGPQEYSSSSVMCGVIDSKASLAGPSACQMLRFPFFMPRNFPIDRSGSGQRAFGFWKRERVVRSRDDLILAMKMKFNICRSSSQ